MGELPSDGEHPLHHGLGFAGLRVASQLLVEAASAKRGYHSIHSLHSRNLVDMFTQPHSPALEAGSGRLLHEGAPLVEVAPDFTASDLRGHVDGRGLLALVVAAAAEQPRRQTRLRAGRNLLRVQCNYFSSFNLIVVSDSE